MLDLARMRTLTFKFNLAMASKWSVDYSSRSRDVFECIRSVLMPLASIPTTHQRSVTIAASPILSQPAWLTLGLVLLRVKYGCECESLGDDWKDWLLFLLTERHSCLARGAWGQEIQDISNKTGILFTVGMLALLPITVPVLLAAGVRRMRDKGETWKDIFADLI
jgi:hypothetical protein